MSPKDFFQKFDSLDKPETFLGDRWEQDVEARLKKPMDNLVSDY